MISVAKRVFCGWHCIMTNLHLFKSAKALLTRYNTQRTLCSGLQSGVEPTLPFPNRVLKRPSADNTAWATVWDDKSRPEQSVFFVEKCILS